MPASYRYEVAAQGRAGCQNSACKKENVKIAKGELRFGTLVQIPNYPDSWKWKHWGCVTPQQIANIIEQLGGLDGLDLDEDLDILDGYDELPDWAQKKVRDALAQGHVDDEDWKGEPELNRPGQKGINKRTPKKKKADDEESGDSAAEDSPVKPKKGGRKKKAASDDEAELVPKKKAASKKRKSVDESEDEADPPPTKKRTAKGKKAAADDGNDDAGNPSSEPAKKKTSRTKKTAVKDEEPEEALSEAPKKRGLSKKAKEELKDEAESAGEAAVPQNDGATDVKASKTKPKTLPKRGVKRVAQADEDAEKQEEAAAPVLTSSKGGRTKKTKVEPAAEDSATDPTPKPVKAAQTKKGKKVVEQEEDEILDASDKKKQSRRGRGKKGVSTATVPEDEQTEAAQPLEPEAAVTTTDVTGDDTVEVEAPAKKDKKKARMGRSARRSSKGEKA